MELASALGVACLRAIYPFWIKDTQTRVDDVGLWAAMSCIAAVVAVAVFAVSRWRTAGVATAWSALSWRRDGVPIVAAAVLGPGLSFYLLLRALSRPGVQTSVVLALAFTTPMFAALFGWLWWGERLGKAQAAGVALIGAGSLLLLLRGGASKKMRAVV